MLLLNHAGNLNHVNEGGPKSIPAAGIFPEHHEIQMFTNQQNYCPSCLPDTFLLNYSCESHGPFLHHCHRIHLWLWSKNRLKRTARCHQITNISFSWMFIVPVLKDHLTWDTISWTDCLHPEHTSYLTFHIHMYHATTDSPDYMLRVRSLKNGIRCMSYHVVIKLWSWSSKTPKNKVCMIA